MMYTNEGTQTFRVSIGCLMTVLCTAETALSKLPSSFHTINRQVNSFVTSDMRTAEMFVKDKKLQLILNSLHVTTHKQMFN